MPAETATLSPVLLADQGHELEQPRHDPLVGPPHGQDDAELRRPDRRGLGRGAQDFVGVEERCGLHRRVEARRLRAEVTVLGTSPRSSPTGSPPPPRWARTRPGAPRAPTTPAPSPTRRAPWRGPPTPRASSSAVLVEQGDARPRRSASSPQARSAAPGAAPGRARRALGGRRCYAWGQRWRRLAPAHGSGRPSRLDTRGSNRGGIQVAWDFETEPEYEAKLAWARAFVDEEILPLETLELDYDDLLRAIRPLQDEVKAPGPVGRPPAPRARGHGLRPGPAGPAPRGARPLLLGAGGLRQQRPGLGQRRAPGGGHRGQRARGAAHPVARAAPGGQAPQRLLHDRARRRARTRPSSPPRRCATARSG